MSNVKPLDEILSIYETLYTNRIARQQKTGQINNLPTFLLFGSPGIGKTEMIKQLSQKMAEKMGKIFITQNELESDISLLEDVRKSKDKYFIFVDFNAQHMEPSDFGIPDLSSDVNVNGVKSYSRKVPLVLACLTQHPGILFLDEITNIQREDLISSLYKLIGEYRVGSYSLHPQVGIIAAGNTDDDVSIIRSELMTPALINRCKIYKVIPPSTEKWFNYITNKYPEVPKYFVGFLAGILENIYTTNTSPVSDIENRKMENRAMTTPRSMERIVSFIADFVANGDSITSDAVLNVLDGDIAESDLAQIKVFMSQMNNLKKLLDSSDKITRATQIAALTYIGEMLGQYAMAYKYENKERLMQVTNHSLLKYEDLPKYVNKLSESKELLNFIGLGAGISNREKSINDSIYAMGFILGALSGMSEKEASQIANKEFNYTIVDMIKNSDLYEKIINKMKGLSGNNKSLQSLINMFDNYNNQYISDIIQKFQEYYIKEHSQYEASELKKYLEKSLGKESFEEVQKIIKEEVENQINKKTVLINKKKSDQSNTRNNP